MKVTDCLPPFWAVGKSYSRAEVNATVTAHAYEIPPLGVLASKMPTQHGSKSRGPLQGKLVE